MKQRLKRLRDKLLGINDSEHRIALGMGLGLFLGVLPGTGPIAAVTSAALLRVNKAAALAGALLVNTWINVVTFPLALAIGAFLFGIEPAALAGDWAALTTHFTWRRFAYIVLHDTVIALFVGYALIGLLLGAAGYAASYKITAARRAGRKPTAE
jgi:uncharacterized protein (DUF2062 family)